MALTIEQALEQAKEAHIAGNLQVAEALYRSVLKVQPKHPDASHNLGVLAISINKPEAALSLFKTALEANPNQGQFWLSYIDTLIKESQFEIAKQVLEQGKERGLAGEKVDNLIQQLEEKRYKILEKKEGPETAMPDQADVDSLLEHYQHERFSEAERSAILITENFPQYQFGWKVLGAVLNQTGKISESLIAKQQAVRLIPSDAEAHINLGNTHQVLGNLVDAESSYKKAIALKPDYAEAYSHMGIVVQELGRLEDSEASYRKAIALKPDYAEAYSNLGITLLALDRLEDAEAICKKAIELRPEFPQAHYNLGNILQAFGRLEESEASYDTAIALSPGYSEAHCNLGGILQELGRLGDAEASCEKAIALKPDLAEAHCNLANTFQALGRLGDAEAGYKKAIAIKPEFAEALLNLSIVQDFLNNLDEAILLSEKVIIIDSDNLGLIAAVNLGIFKFLEDDFAASKKYLLASSEIESKSSVDLKNYENSRIYSSYLLKILSWHENQSVFSSESLAGKTLFVVGESHALASHGVSVKTLNGDYLCKSLLIMGCKQWHLGNPSRNKYKSKLEVIFCTLSCSSDILLAVGEIDCRLDGGIIKHNNKYPEKNKLDLIATTVENYINYIFKINSPYQHRITIQGVPCPNINPKNASKEEVSELVDLIREFNAVLRRKSAEVGFDFLDVYKISDRGDGFSNLIWHLDSFHLSPEGMQEAWRSSLRG